MKRQEIEAEIQLIENKISEYEHALTDMRKELNVLIKQEKERENYISSSEIVQLVFDHIGKKINMSTIKRWADEGYLGDIIEERDKFWALRHKQGKKRFLYPIVDVYHFLYEKGYLYPKYDVLDRVQVTNLDKEPIIGVVIDSQLKLATFHYNVQIEGSFEQLTAIKEEDLTKLE